jgi:hypothetical protein
MEDFLLIFAYLGLVVVSLACGAISAVVKRHSRYSAAWNVGALMTPSLLLSLFLTGSYGVQEIQHENGRKSSWFGEAKVPLTGGYEVAYDAHAVERAALRRQDGPPVLEAVNKLQVINDDIVGSYKWDHSHFRSDSELYFLLHTRANKIERFSTEQDLMDRLGHPVALKTTEEFYNSAP